MPKAIFVTSNGDEVALEVGPGTSLMRAAVMQGVEGILGDCGGTLGCATCHVFVDPEYLALLPPISDNEEQMLECTAAPRLPNSRLSCQIEMGPALDGIRVQIAEPQV
jgi:2Fe-2S ferredoxin